MVALPSIWTLATRAISPSVIGAELLMDGARMSVAEVARHWASNSAFAAAWTASLRRIPFTACCWETPPLLRATVNQPFECVFVESPDLALSRADGTAFAERFRSAANDGAVLFESLGKDALLVAPSPTDPDTDYCHLAAFARTATEIQAIQFWQAVASGLQQRIGSTPVWLSTAGLGVSWLHVRLDSRPKYYRHRPYTSPQFRDRRA